MKKHNPYELIRAKSGNVYMTAAYCKYYLQLPYAALFEEYPASITKVVLLRRVEEHEQNSFGVRLCKLIHHQADGAAKEIGLYVPICTVSSEKEATEELEKNVRGKAAVAELFGGAGR